MKNTQPLSLDSPSSHSGSTNADVLRVSIWLWLQQIADMSLAFVFSWVALRNLGPAGFGALTLSQAVLNMAALGTFNFEQALLRDLPRFVSIADGKAIRHTWWLVLGSKSLLALLMALVLWFSADSISSFYGNPDLAPTLRIGSVSVFAAALTEVGAAACLALFYAQIRILVTLIRRSFEVGGIFLLSFGNISLAETMGVLALADCIAATIYLTASLYLVYRKKYLSHTPSFSTGELLRNIFNYSLPLMGARVSEVVGKEVGKLMLGRLVSAAELGFYSVARLIAERLVTIFAQAPLAAVPVLAVRFEEASSTKRPEAAIKLVEKLIIYQTIAAGMAGLGIVGISPLFVILVGGVDYLPAVPVVRSVSMLLIFWGAVAPLHTLFMAYGRTIGILYLNLSQILATLLLYLVLSPYLQAIGAGLADALGYVAALMMGLLIVRRWFAYPLQKVLFPLIRLLLPLPALMIVLMLCKNYIVSIFLLCVVEWSYFTYILLMRGIEPELLKDASQLKIKILWMHKLVQGILKIILNYQLWLLDLIRKIREFKAPGRG